MKFNKGVAYEEDVFSRALDILEEEGISIDLLQLKRIYEISAKNTKWALNNEEYCSIRLPHIGKAYYHLYDINNIKKSKKNQLLYMEHVEQSSKEKLKKELSVWEDKYNFIKLEYEKYRPKYNVSKEYMLYHIIQNLRRAIKRRKIDYSEVEETQNAIK